MRIFRNATLIIITAVTAFFFGRQKQRTNNEKKKTEELVEAIDDTRKIKKDISKLTRIEKLKRL